MNAARRLVPLLMLPLGLGALTDCAGMSGRGSADTAPDLKLAAIELASGAPDAALLTAQSVLRAAPHNNNAQTVQAWNIAADAQSALGQTELAEASYHRALALDGNDMAALLGRARLHLVQDPRAAGAEFQALATAHPHDARAWTDLGVACDLQGRAAEAQAAYRTALNADPMSAAAQADLGLSLALSGHAADATALLRPLATAPQATARLRGDYAVAASLNGQPAEARAALAQDLPAAQLDVALARYADLRHAPP